MLAFLRRSWARAITLGLCLTVMWVLAAANFISGGRLAYSFGIQPRTLWGLLMIPVAPLLHHSLAHVAANTLPLLVLGWLVMSEQLRWGPVVAGAGALGAGLGAWLLGGSHSVHVGASGIVFACFGFLIARAVITRNVWSIGSALLAVLFFGGALWGTLPFVAGANVSWQSHLFGLVAGALVARPAGKRRR